MKCLKYAFSLVELMVTLIVISVITAAMAPMITKKLKSGSITISGGGKGLSVNCSKFGTSCGLCEGDVCVSCTKSCTENEALDVSACNCKLCSEDDFHGSACLKCDMENCSKCTDGYYLVSGVCTLCEDGYTCDGTNQTLCPAGYYCAAGITTPCSAGTYNETTGATDSTSCISCSTKTANCTNCDIASGVCSGCNNGYTLDGAVCKSNAFTYTYSGTASKTATTEYTRIVLTTSGTFTANSGASVEVLILGGGGGGGGAAWHSNAGGDGCSGYNEITSLVFESGDTYTVTIGGGGSGGAGGKESDHSAGSAGGTGGASVFAGISASGGPGGYGGNYGGTPCSGGSAVTFAGNTYASGIGKGANTGTGGAAGSGWNGGNAYTNGKAGNAGNSGVVVIMIPK